MSNLINEVEHLTPAITRRLPTLAGLLICYVEGKYIARIYLFGMGSGCAELKTSEL